MGNIKSYTLGFALSVILTLSAFFAVSGNWLAGNAAVAFIAVLAVIQLLVQLFFFLHLGSESKPRWNLMTFLFMLMVVIIVVGGSLWIMYNLDYHGMPAHEAGQSIIEDEGIGQ